MADNIESIQYINLGDGEGNRPIDAVTVGGKTIPDNISSLPDVTSSDNGKVLRVVNGQWVMVSPAIIYSEDGEPSDEHGNDGDLDLTIGYSFDHNGDPMRHANVIIHDFSVSRLS